MILGGGREGGRVFQFYLGKSENLSSFQVLLLLHRALGGREGGFVSFTWVNLKIGAHLPFDSLLHRRSFRITYERPKNRYVIC